ncbi:MAG TPA: polyphosphate kinase 1 [Acidobacteriota bacterium]|nr:polyphosphate kinase 1 [Acidobacteriota bacterium]
MAEGKVIEAKEAKEAKGAKPSQDRKAVQADLEAQAEGEQVPGPPQLKAILPTDEEDIARVAHPLPEDVTDLEDPTLFFNRELSWLKFNEMVLEEALDTRNPLLDRVNFLSIFYSNLDEFFMVRVSGLRRQMQSGVLGAPPDGMTPTEQLASIREQLLPILETAQHCWKKDLAPKLRRQGIRLHRYKELSQRQKHLLRGRFKKDIFPVLTPLAVDPGHPFPHISNLSINLAVVVQDPKEGERFARLKVPQTLPRLMRIPENDDFESTYESMGLRDLNAANLIWLEEVVAANLDLLFPGLEVTASYAFRVTRDADFEIEEDEASDLLSAMSEVVSMRHFGSAVRLEVDSKMPQVNRDLLTRNVGVEPYQVYEMRNPIGLAHLSELNSVDRPGLRYPRYLPMVSGALQEKSDIFATLRQRRDTVLYHPYDGFMPVVNFLQQAARDPQVLAIKQTLYRVGTNSPIVEALMEARENGIQVSALVELKARFDEENNIGWAQALERAGVHVVYGVLGLKTHAKMCLVVRREREGLRCYAHLSTGNYNPFTARIYTDLGFFTCRQDIAEDVSDLFNSLTGYSRKQEYRKLLVAPGRMRDQIISRIDREISKHEQEGCGHLAFKMNALVDQRCIQALYRASQAGLRVDLQVRGICCLRPGIPGVSDNITVTSIVGRFLEHSRIYYFRNGGDEELLVGSADLMPRNLDHRVETLFPVEDPALLKAIRDDVLFLHLRDNVKARLLLPDGTRMRLRPAKGQAAIDSQHYLVKKGGGWRTESAASSREESKGVFGPRQ